MSYSCGKFGVRDFSEAWPLSSPDSHRAVARVGDRSRSAWVRLPAPHTNPLGRFPLSLLSQFHLKEEPKRVV